MRTVALAVVLAIGLAICPAALAHQGNPNYRSVIDSVSPDPAGFKIEVLNYDDSLSAVNDSKKTITIVGYDGEPYLRFLPNLVVEVNSNSPAYYLNVDRSDTQEVPKSASSKTTPKWKVVARNGRYIWHDHRIHRMSTSIPPQVKDQSKRTKVVDWKIPISADAQSGAISGTLFWQPSESGGIPMPALIGLLVLIVLSLVSVVVVKRRRRTDEPEQPESEKEAW